MSERLTELTIVLFPHPLGSRAMARDLPSSSR